jgi:large subunit ribosomal protein L5
MAKTESGKSSKTSERRSPKKKEGSPALQAKDEGSEESKFNPRMREAYLQKVVPALMKEFGYKNIMQVPKLERIVLNVGMGEAIQNVKLLESAAGELGAITGQKPLITKAKKAIASFKLRQGMPIGTMVT